MEKSTKDLHSSIESLKYKIDRISLPASDCIDKNKYARYYIRQFDELNISAEDLIDKGLVNYMKSIGDRFRERELKREADVVARKWQHQVDMWLEESNLAENRKLERLLNDSKKLIDEKPIPPLSPHLNGTWKAHQRDSDSDYRQNYHSSSSQEVESPDSQKHTQRNSSFNCRSNNPSFSLPPYQRNSSSPLQLENPGTQNISSAEFNANLSIDTTEVTPINRTPESPVKPFFSVPLKVNMFKAVKLRKPPMQGNLERLLHICDILKLPPRQYPRYLREYQETQKSVDQTLKENSDTTNCSKSLNGKTDKKIDSHHLPSTSQQESSRSCPESKLDRKRKRTESPQPVVKVKDEQQPSLAGKLKHRETSLSAAKAKDIKEEQKSSHDGKVRHRETSQSVAKVKELKEEHQSSHDGKLKPREITQSLAKAKELKDEHQSSHDGKLKHREATQSLAKVKELKEERQSSHEGKLKHRETTQSLAKAKELKEEQQHSYDGKLKHRETTLSATKAKELKEEHKPSHDGKLKHMARTQPVVKDREPKAESQFSQGRALKCKESTQSFPKFKELRVELHPLQDMKLDTKRVCAMVPEARHCDKNNFKKRDSPDQSAMIAITSSKKERTSVYHGGKKCEMPKLKDLCMRVLLKGLKQTSDPTKYINKDVSFEALEPILVQLSPEKLHKLEEEKKYLLASTDQVWKLNCEKKFKSLVHLIRKNESWRAFYERCCMESNEKLKNLTASINASASKGKPDRQIKLTTVEGPPTKRQKTDYANSTKLNGNISANKPLPNSTHPSNSRSVVPVPPKGTPNHSKPAHRTIKKDAPLMHKAKKTLGQLNRIHRN